jgi:5-bromo-4-chloroindolyl phosphate hydrolysis protein
MKIIISLLLIISVNFHSVENKEVYICDSKGAKKYHYTNTCRGLSACKHEIVKKTLSEAKDLGLTLCGWED